jgi:biopolymer transport protein ExbB/TolQ
MNLTELLPMNLTELLSIFLVVLFIYAMVVAILLVIWLIYASVIVIVKRVRRDILRFAIVRFEQSQHDSELEV